VLRIKVRGDKPLSANSKTVIRNMFTLSRLQSLMKAFPRTAFDRAVTEYGADKGRKGFGCWDQLVAMVYGQLSNADSLRRLECGFNQHGRHHHHLGTRAVSRSTLADANARTSPQVFARAAQALMQCAPRTARREGRQVLELLDSTSFTLKGRHFDAWTQDSATRNTQGLKLHVLLDADQQMPRQLDFSPANVNDIDQARQQIEPQPQTCYVFDKGYCDYAWWKRIDDAQAHFVTRFKSNAAFDVVDSRTRSDAADDAILRDQIVRFGRRHPRGGHRNPYDKPLRCVTVRRPGKPWPLVLATNDLHSPAAVIAQRYKQRWDIELFFKWIKQNLGVRRFLGRSQNAVKIQILSALIAYLLVGLYRLQHCPSLSMLDCLTQLRTGLFQRPAIDAHHHRVHQQRQRDAALLRQQRCFAW
jgi:putative transposase